MLFSCAHRTAAPLSRIEAPNSEFRAPVFRVRSADAWRSWDGPHPALRASHPQACASVLGGSGRWDWEPRGLAFLASASNCHLLAPRSRGPARGDEASSTTTCMWFSARRPARRGCAVQCHAAAGRCGGDATAAAGRPPPCPRATAAVALPLPARVTHPAQLGMVAESKGAYTWVFKESFGIQANPTVFKFNS